MCHREVVYLFFFSNFLGFFSNFLGRTPGHGTGGPGCTSATAGVVQAMAVRPWDADKCGWEITRRAPDAIAAV